MSTRRLTALVPLMLALLAGCGSSKPGPQIPASQANNLISRLQEAERRADPAKNACFDLLHDTIPALQQQLTQLPQNLDSNVRTTLTDGISRLQQLAQQQCSSQQQQQTTTNTTPTTTQSTTTPVPSTTVAPTPPSTSTRTTTAPPTTTMTTTTPAPPGGTGGIGPGNGNGPGNGPGKGNGGPHGHGGGQ